MQTPTPGSDSKAADSKPADSASASLDAFARATRRRAIWSTLALWTIAVGALVMAFR